MPWWNKAKSEEMDVFFAGARRYDCKVDYVFSGDCEQLIATAQLGHSGAGDVFFWSNGFFQDKNMPPFAIGRSVIDSWMIYTAIKHNCCIDITDGCYCFHQNHDPNPASKTGAWTPSDYEDFSENQRLWRECEAYQKTNVEIGYANYIFRHNSLKKNYRFSGL